MLNGFIAATHTPFRTNGDIDCDAVPKYVRYLIDTGMDGLFVNGTTGEGISLSVVERKTTLEAFVRAADGRLPVVAHVGANALSECRELAAHAESLGVAAVSACAPSFFKFADAAVLVDAMKEIADAASKTPFYYYHIPKFTGSTIDMGRFLAESDTKIPNLAGVKFSDTKVFEFLEILQFGNGKLNALWGCDEMFLSALAVGTTGAVGSTYPLCNVVFRNVIESWESRDFESARRWQHRSWEYVKVLCRYGEFFAGQRALMKSFGIDLGPSRLPIAIMSPDAEKRMFDDLRTIGYFDWRKVRVQDIGGAAGSRRG